jgi:hypothetical protein
MVSTCSQKLYNFVFIVNLPFIERRCALSSGRDLLLRS